MLLRQIAGACLLGSVAATAFAQDTPSAKPDDAHSATPAPRPVPMRAPRHPEPAGVQRVNSVDIPQWAKDEGHNGTASFIALVGADSRLIRLELDRSSGSPAIDAAARERAESLYYMAATDASGAKVEGTVKVRLGYARHDPDSPGGGLDDYTCRDLVKEYRWFARANAGVRRIFWLENAYTSMDVLGQLQSGAVPSLEQRQKQRAVREKQWKALLKRCEKAPDGLFLDQVEERDNYLRLVNAF